MHKIACLFVSHGGHLDPVGVHMCGYMASESHGRAGLEVCPAPGQSSPYKCPFWLRDLASPFLPL